MRNLFKLKDCSDDDLKNIQVGYDLSKTEREKVQAKIEEAKSKSNDQDFWTVRGPPWALRLIKTERHSQPQTPPS